VSHFCISGDADDRAQEKGVLLLGECGLDPGIDSMSAVSPTVAKSTNDQGGNADLRSSQEGGEEGDFLRFLVWWSTRTKR
jgi:saccharopine dehydrogenase-like NADP-dependent oxidoreductase